MEDHYQRTKDLNRKSKEEKKQEKKELKLALQRLGTGKAPSMSQRSNQRSKEQSKTKVSIGLLPPRLPLHTDAAFQASQPQHDFATAGEEKYIFSGNGKAKMPRKSKAPTVGPSTQDAGGQPEWFADPDTESDESPPPRPRPTTRFADNSDRHWSRSPLPYDFQLRYGAPRHARTPIPEDLRALKGLLGMVPGMTERAINDAVRDIVAMETKSRMTDLENTLKEEFSDDQHLPAVQNLTNAWAQQSSETHAEFDSMAKHNQGVHETIITHVNEVAATNHTNMAKLVADHAVLASRFEKLEAQNAALVKAHAALMKAQEESSSSDESSSDSDRKKKDKRKKKNKAKSHR
ncbi:hypothetical protein LTR86_003055 [Recurvomyces mirabilis]|nr:hypothetical protein LTR86_003055 [Recurvomyces mirabilis]